MRKLIIKLIALYRRFISPFKWTKCPYIPTCSEYGEEAVKKHGALVGITLAAWRVVRCNPFSSGGFDPVPEKGFLLRGLKDRAPRMIYIDKAKEEAVQWK